MQTMLYICTGNYYRSRFAQGLFNHFAAKHDLPWKAISRGLRINAVDQPGELSIFTREALEARGIPLELAGEKRVSLCIGDLIHADQVWALKHTEHHPLMQEQFPDWADRIQYKEIHDLDGFTPQEALPAIEQFVQQQVEEIRQNFNNG